MNIFPDWIKSAEELYKKGNSYASIGRTLGVNRKLVSKYLRELGYKSNLKFYGGDRSKTTKKNFVNDDIFSVIDSEEKAYWLGFLYADGHVNSMSNCIELSLKEEDYNHLVKFKNFMSFTGNISRRVKKTANKDYVGYRVSFHSEKVKSDLINLGCVARKSNSLKFPTHQQVPKNMMRHFVRGYMDGDGCIYVSPKGMVSVEVLGTDEFLLGYMSYVKKLGVKKNNLNSFSHSSVKRAMHNSKEAFVILDELYKDSNIYLDRKKNKYNNLPSRDESH